MYSMYDCLNTPPQLCHLPPPMVHHAKDLLSKAYGNMSVPCGNLVQEKADTSVGRMTAVRSTRTDVVTVCRQRCSQGSHLRSPS